MRCFSIASTSVTGRHLRGPPFQDDLLAFNGDTGSQGRKQLVDDREQFDNALTSLMGLANAVRGTSYQLTLVQVDLSHRVWHKVMPVTVVG